MLAAKDATLPWRPFRTQRPRAKWSFACHASTTSGPSRRLVMLHLASCTASLSCLRPAAAVIDAADLPLAPPAGDCPECIGEVNSSLNACEYSEASCVSSQNDDEKHFILPWMYEGSQADALNKLLDLATGGSSYTSSKGAGQVSRSDAASFIFEGFAATVFGRRPPARPEPRQSDGAEELRFDGVLADRHRSEDGSEYLHLVFGTRTDDGRKKAAGGVIDAEFLFLSGDAVVNIRAGSRVAPGPGARALQLSLSEGLQFDSNLARRQLDALRVALHWEAVPVITDFNSAKAPFFERLYKPFLSSELQAEAQR